MLPRSERISADGQRQLTRTVLRALCLAAVLTAAACRLPPPGTPNFQDGYTAGCNDAAVDAPGGQTGQPTWMRDENRFTSQPDYKEGWQEGFVACYRQWMETPAVGNRGT